MRAPTATERAWAYRVLVAVVPVLTIYGVLDENTAAAWLGVAAAVLGLGLATANTSTTPD
jgi:hypothetical protein